MGLEMVKKMLIELDIDHIQNEVEHALQQHSPLDVLETLSAAMIEVGQLYEAQDYYLPELVLAGETMKEALIILKPLLQTERRQKKGTIVIATVKGDLHDLGKNIAAMMLSAGGYEIIDLGKDVDPWVIARKAAETHADIVALSTLLTMTVSEIGNTVKALEAIGIRQRISIICGGPPINQELVQRFGADYACESATTAVQLCDRILKRKCC